MIPKNITREHIIQAINEIDQNGIANPLHQSRKVDLVFEGKKYPPKHIVCLANKFANGEIIPFDQTTTHEAQRYLVKIDPKFVIQKRDADPLAKLVEQYKEHIKKYGIGTELYKWLLLGKFSGKPDINASDFTSEYLSTNYDNLLYPVGKGAIAHLARDRSEQYRVCFSALLNEETPLEQRIKTFYADTLALYREIVPNPKLMHHQDERTMATFLTFHNPNKYTFYKDGFYQTLCKLIGEQPKKPLEKYVHYLSIVELFIKEYIETDEELVEMVATRIPTNCFQDQKHLILAQDIFYQMLEKLPKNGQVIGLMASDGTGWQENHIKNTKELQLSIVWNSKTPSGKDETLNALRSIVKEENTFNLYYASGGKARYKATVVDFARNEQEYLECDWSNRFENINYHESLFKDYTEENKSASIVFLISSLEKIPELPVSEFRFYKKFEEPRQDNLSPISFEPNPNTMEEIYDNKDQNNNMAKSLNQILFGPPGTGKTYNTISHSVAIVENKSVSEIVEECKSNRDAVKKRYNNYVNSGLIVFTTFHQSMSYEEFIEGIKPQSPEKDQPLKYDIDDGLFKIICAKAEDNWFSFQNKVPSNKTFEELFEMMKEEWANNKSMKFSMKTEGKEFTITGFTKKSINFKKASGGEGHSLSINTLKDIFHEKREAWSTGVGIYYPGLIEKLEEFAPKSKSESIELKNYVLIIDEINRGNVSQIFGELITLIEEDKRIGKKEALKTTLPYSTDEFGVPPNLYIIGTMNTADRSVEALDTALRRRFSFEEKMPDPSLITETVLGIPLKEVLVQMNDRIERLLDRDHTIGHSYFMNVKDEHELKSRFKNKILPLLQEYFYGDYGKIGLVLGSGFVNDNVKTNKKPFAPFKYPNGTDQFDSQKFELIPIDDDFKIIEAVKTLIGN